MAFVSLLKNSKNNFNLFSNFPQICFQSVGKTNVLKKNLRQFDGFDFENGSQEFKKRVEASQKLELTKLKAVCEGLQLDKKGPKEIICQRIVEFLVAPHIIDVPSDDEEDDDDDDDAEDAVEGMYFTW